MPKHFNDLRSQEDSNNLLMAIRSGEFTTLQLGDEFQYFNCTSKYHNNLTVPEQIVDLLVYTENGEKLSKDLAQNFNEIIKLLREGKVTTNALWFQHQSKSAHRIKREKSLELSGDSQQITLGLKKNSFFSVKQEQEVGLSYPPTSALDQELTALFDTLDPLIPEVNNVSFG